MLRSVIYDTDPGPGEAIFLLVSGNPLALERRLGTDSAGVETTKPTHIAARCSAMTHTCPPFQSQGTGVTTGLRMNWPALV